MTPERAREITASFDLRQLHADLMAVYRDAATFSSDKVAEFTPKFGTPPYGSGANAPLLAHHTTSLVFNEPPLHTRLRKLMMGALTRRAIDQMENGLVTQVDALLDKIAAQGGGSAEQLSEQELLHNCIFILNAGHETTTNLIGNALVALQNWPD
jgi:cytochrome P450